MKTLTVTYQNEINYGAVLQAYALHHQLKDLGVDDYLLNLESSSPVYFFHRDKYPRITSYIYNNLYNLLYISSTIQKVRKFKRFVKENISTTKLYKSLEDVKNDPPEADVYITGSDQMFNCFSRVKENNFLQFGRRDIKRISYATSMGQKKVDDAFINGFVAAIKSYASLSVREQSLKDYISKVCGRDCEVNIDPTFLLEKEEWNRFIGDRPIKGKYILCYALLYNPLVKQVMERLKQLTGLRTVVISPYARNPFKGDINIRSVGIEEFLTLFKHAEYVLTTSFHGTCFSIIFEKKFFTFIREGVETRITNLLEKLGLEYRIVSHVSQISCEDVNFQFAREVINEEKKRAIRYLIEALNL